MNPEKLPNSSIRLSSGGMDFAGLEIYKRISSAYNDRYWGLPIVVIGSILRCCLILAASGSIDMANKETGGIPVVCHVIV